MNHTQQSNNNYNEIKYLTSHEWLKIHEKQKPSDNNQQSQEYIIATIGITNYAKDMLGDIVFISLPKINDSITQNKEFAVIESVKAASDIYAPVTARIIEVNQELLDNVEIFNNTSANDLWLVKVAITINEANNKAIESLLDTESYNKIIGV